jgi:hypothetical protein
LATTHDTHKAAPFFIAKPVINAPQKGAKVELKAYCESMWNSWPKALQEQQITALLFELPGSSAEERCLFEKGLQELTIPRMS